GAPHESFNRRIPIDAPEDETGATTVPLSIVARDETGATVSRDFQVEVRPVMLKSRESRMPVAVLAFAGNGVEPALAELLRVSTEGELVNGDRFRVVDRTRLQDVLTEQQLSAALGDPNQAIQLGKLTPAHVFLVADVFPRDQQGIEVKARVISTETSDVVATLDTFIDNRDDRAKVTAGCAAIVSQLAALFPRLSGELLAVRGQDAGAEVLVNWTPEDGVRPGAYMLVVREEEPWVDEDTGEVLAPGEYVEVGRAKVQSVQSSGARARTVEQTQEGRQLEKGMPAITM
ncbi:MAG TPA: CsgG/HfaB family protein, partial [Candidatus Hydrogenedentes bacterium]|nr:CsgG/HfaB family protein [Candidatus Hydrogenedentota bacterium]